MSLTRETELRLYQKISDIVARDTHNSEVISNLLLDLGGECTSDLTPEQYITFESQLDELWENG